MLRRLVVTHMKDENKEQVLLAYRKRMFGHSAKEIIRFIKNENDEEAPDLGSIESWISTFDEIPESERLKDGVFDWYKMEIYGLPWTASHSLLSAIPLLKRLEDPLSVRCILWYWRLLQVSLDGAWRPDQIGSLLSLTASWTQYDRENILGLEHKIGSRHLTDRTQSFSLTDGA